MLPKNVCCFETLLLCRVPKGKERAGRSPPCDASTFHPSYIPSLRIPSRPGWEGARLCPMMHLVFFMLDYKGSSGTPPPPQPLWTSQSDQLVPPPERGGEGRHYAKDWRDRAWTPDSRGRTRVWRKRACCWLCFRTHAGLSGNAPICTELCCLECSSSLRPVHPGPARPSGAWVGGCGRSHCRGLSLLKHAFDYH